jgi:hypothetical protein
MPSKKRSNRGVSKTPAESGCLPSSSSNQKNKPNSKRSSRTEETEDETSTSDAVAVLSQPEADSGDREAADAAMGGPPAMVGTAAVVGGNSAVTGATPVVTATPAVTATSAVTGWTPFRFLDLPLEVKYLLYSFLGAFPPIYCMIKPLNDPACHCLHSIKGYCIPLRDLPLN